MGQELEFKISSGLKDIIGKELITDEQIAIFELVKNSYDANAKTVKIIFQNIKDENKIKGSKILIIDDGNGMSYNDLVNKWLFVGYSDKKEFEKQLENPDFRDKIGKNKRVFAGAKGIGRFSCDRLGGKLDLYTKRGNEDITHHLHMDWNEFEDDPKKEFQTVKVAYDSNGNYSIGNYGIKNKNQWTILEISSLRDNSWDRKTLLKLKRYLQRLINPIQVGDERDFEIYLDAEDFLEDDKNAKEDYDKVNGIVENIIFEKLGIKTAQINCKINETGDKICTKLIDKGEFIFSLEEINEEFPLLKNINITLFYLNRGSKITFTKTMGLEPVNFGSVFLYKNGFRVHSYGDIGDDSFGIDRRKSQGTKRYLGNRDLIGRIEINGFQPDFREVSSRDGGVIKTSAYYQLTGNNGFLIKKCLKRLEKYVVEGLDWDNIEDRPKNPEEIKTDSLEIIKQITGQVKDPDKELKFNENLLEIVKEKQVEKLPEIIKNIESLKKSVKDPKEEEFIETQLKALKHALASKLKSLEDEVKQAEKEKKEAEEELKATKKTSLFLSKAISTDEDVKTALNHSIKVTTFSIDTLIKDINQKVNEGKNVSDILPLIDEIDLENQKIQILSKYVSFAGFETKVESIKKDLVLYIKEYLDRILNKRKNRLKIEFINENIEFNKRFHPLEISLVIDNLIDNARKASATSLKVKFENIDKTLHLFISDNSDGVPDEIKKFIFNRGYTTTDGSGIGLYHVKQILTGMGADIEFIGNNVQDLGKGACFELVFK